MSAILKALLKIHNLESNSYSYESLARLASKSKPDLYEKVYTMMQNAIPGGASLTNSIRLETLKKQTNKVGFSIPVLLNKQDNFITLISRDNEDVITRKSIFIRYLESK